MSDPRPADVRAALVVLAPFALCALAVAGAPLFDPDVWWIAAAGRVIAETHHVPTRNLFSFAEPAHPWVMHEWLYGLPYYLGARLGGARFFQICGVAGGVALYVLYLRAAVWPRRHAAAGLALALLLVVVGNVALFAPRPSATSLVLPVAMAWLAFGGAWSRRRAALAVALELAWANLHGSFPIGLALLAVAGIEDAPARASRMATLAAALVATLATPYGPRLYGLVGGYAVGGDGVFAVIQANIAEFAPLWRAPLMLDKLLPLAALAALALTALARRRLVARALFVLVLIAMALRSARHVTLALTIAPILLGPVLDDLFARRGGAPLAAATRRMAERLLLVTAVFAAGWIVAANGKLTRDDAAVATLVDRLPDGARVYVPFRPSALAIWRAAPRGVLVLYDPRNDCYSRSTAERAMRLERGLGDAAALRADVEADGTNFAIVAARGPLARALEHAPGWSLRAADDGWLLVGRR